MVDHLKDCDCDQHTIEMARAFDELLDAFKRWLKLSRFEHIMDGETNPLAIMAKAIMPRVTALWQKEHFEIKEADAFHKMMDTLMRFLDLEEQENLEAWLRDGPRVRRAEDLEADEHRRQLRAIFLHFDRLYRLHLEWSSR